MAKGDKEQENMAAEQQAMEQTEQAEPKKSRRDSFREGFATRHPDIDMDDEEAYYGALDDEYNSREEELNRNREDNKKLNDMFMENPEAAYLFNDILDGKEQLGVSLMRHFGQTFKDAVDDPTDENVKAFAKAMEDHAAKIKENDELEDAFEKNAEASQETIDQWASEKGLNPEQVAATRDFINAQFANMLSGYISRDMLEMAYKGLNYDKDVAAAEETGAAQGRNEKIKEQLRKGKGDGMPMIQGGANTQGKPKDNFLQSGRKDPWESAKREKY